MKLISIPANPVPDNFVTDCLKTPDGVSLRFARWQPPPGRRGTVCIFQGRGEWIEKYFETVRDLRARGFAVATLDWRGQGLSDRGLTDRHKGHVHSFSEYDTDLETFMREVVLPDCPPPLFAIGHSTGATVLIRAAYRGHRWFDRVVLIAPLIGLAGAGSTATARGIVRVLRLAGFGSNYVPGGESVIMELRPFAGNYLTSDPVRYARNAAVLEAEPSRPPDGYLVRCRVPRQARGPRSRLCIAHPPADADRVVRARCAGLQQGDRRIRQPAARRLASGHSRRQA